MIFEILPGAAGGGGSAGNTCKMMRDVPCGSGIRCHPEKYDGTGEPETGPDNAPQDRLPPRIHKGKQCAAADLNLIPYYGTPSPSEERYICGSRAESGACPFYAYAALYVIRKRKRVTAAVTAVRRDDTDVAVISRLPDKTGPPGPGIKRLLPGGGFYSVPVIWRLKAPGIPSGIPAVIRGKTAGTRRLLRGGGSYGTVYTMNSREYGSATFHVRTVCVYSRGGYGRHGIGYSACAVYKTRMKLRAVRDGYGRRSGIGAGCRLKNRCRIRTPSGNPAARLLSAGTAFILTDIRICLIREHISLPGKGGRLLLHPCFLPDLCPLFCVRRPTLKNKTVNSININKLKSLNKNF